MAATQQAPPSESMIDSMLFCCSPRGRREEPSNLFVSEMMFYRKAEEVKEWKPSRPTSNAEKLKLYALFKQGTEGDVVGPRPGIFNQVDRAKWDAWKLLEEKSKEEAMTEYVDEADRQMAEFS